MSTSIRSVALIDPLGDYGIGGYTFEFAEGLAANGVQVDVYTSGRHIPIARPRSHRVYPVLGSVLLKQRGVLGGEGAPTPAPAAGPSPAPSPRAAPSPARLGRLRRSRLLAGARAWLVALELAVYLKWKGYDLVWTQWPTMDADAFWGLGRLLGLRMVHTVHNVLPHEETPGAHEACGAVYRRVQHLVVHSEYSRAELGRVFPAVAHKAEVAPLGLYTMFRRAPGARARLRSRHGVPDGRVALLFFGGIRPYKNIDSVLLALRDERCRDMILLVSGAESGYPDCVPGDVLGRTRRRAEELGVSDRLRLIPGPLDLDGTSELFEASDVVVLPYGKSYGSGLLLLGMTFGKHVVATETGGIGEYLGDYPSSTVLAGADADAVAEGLHRAAARVGPPTADDPRDAVGIPRLRWPAVAAGILNALERRLRGAERRSPVHPIRSWLTHRP